MATSKLTLLNATTGIKTDFITNNPSEDIVIMLPIKSGTLLTVEDIDSVITTATTDIVNNMTGLISQIENISYEITKPTIVSPLNGAISGNNTIIGSIYSQTLAFIGEHDYSHWVISTVSDFSTIITESTVDNLIQWSPAIGLSNTVVYVKVRYGSDNHLSDWSDVVSFTTANKFISTPSITQPTNSATGVAVNTVLTSTPFNIAGSSETHISSTWEVATDAAFTNKVVNYIDNTTNLSSLNVSLVSNTKYYAMVSYKSATLVSGTSDVISFTTAAMVAPILSGTNTTNENTIIIISISNFDVAATYNASVDFGTITMAGSAISWVIGPVTADKTATLSISSTTAAGVSSITTKTITIANVAIISDIALSIANFAQYQTNTVWSM